MAVSRSTESLSSSTDKAITREFLSDVTTTFIVENTNLNETPMDPVTELWTSASQLMENVFNVNRTDADAIMDLLHEDAITDLLHGDDQYSITTTAMDLITVAGTTDDIRGLAFDGIVGGLLEDAPWQGGLYVSTLFCLIVLGTIGNLLIIGAYFSQKGLNVVGTEFILNLAVADLIIAAVALPMCMVGAVHGKAYFETRPVLCEMIGFLCLMGCVGALLSIVAVSVNRLVFVCFNELHGALYKPKYVWMMVAGIWCIAFAIDMPHFIALHEGHHFDAEVMQCNWNRSASTGYTIMIIAIILGSIALMVTIYVIIFQKVRKVTGQLGSDDDRSRSAPYTSGSNQGPMATNMSGNQGGTAPLATSMGDNQGSLATNKSGLGSSQDAAPPGRYSGMYNKGVTPIDNNKVNEFPQGQQHKVKGWKMCKTLMIIVCAYVICWLPYCLVVLIDLIHDLPLSAHLWTTLLAHAHSSVSFVIYASTSERYSQAYAQMCCVGGFLAYLNAEYSFRQEMEEEEGEKEKEKGKAQHPA